MPNIILSIPEDLLKNGRRYAQTRGTSLNALVRDLLSEKVSNPADSAESMLTRLRDSTGDSKASRSATRSSKSGGKEIAASEAFRHALMKL